MEGFLLALIFFGALALMCIWWRGKSDSTVSDGKLVCQDVSIDLETKNVTIGSRIYKREKVTGVRWDNDGQIGWLSIDINDLNYPVHRMKFLKCDKAEEFGKKIALALEF